MALVTFKDLCIDAVDVTALEDFWSATLGLSIETFPDGERVLRGPTPQDTVWVNAVPEAKQVKDRVHLDVQAPSLDAFASLPHLSRPGDFDWTVLADPEGNEFCVFTYPDRGPGLKDVVVDAVEPRAIAAWWADVLGGTLCHDDDYSYVDDVPGAPVGSFDFVPVPEPKTVKNRIHWDVTLTDGASVDDLVSRGATVLAGPTDDDPWTVVADPEGNEFCVFPHVVK